jgi:DNA-binding LacI/PurR family transcriptional regulator
VSPAVIVAMGGLPAPDQKSVEQSPAKFMKVQGILPNVEAGRMQARYLFEQGHTRLGYAFPRSDARAIIALERLEGTREECKRLGIPEPLVHDIDVDDPDSVFRAVDAWVTSPENVTAICAHNDEVAILLDGALAARGLRAGKDIALIGVDNIPSARISLTTIEIDVEAFGDAVVQGVLALLEDREVPEVHGEDMLRLIVRSTA